MVTVRVRFLSSLQTIAGCAETVVALEGKPGLDDLLETLVSTYGPSILGSQAEYQWRHSTDRVLVAVNDRLVSEREEDRARPKLSDGDVISLFPPLSGG